MKAREYLKSPPFHYLRGFADQTLRKQLRQLGRLRTLVLVSS